MSASRSINIVGIRGWIIFYERCIFAYILRWFQTVIAITGDFWEFPAKIREKLTFSKKNLNPSVNVKDLEE